MMSDSLSYKVCLRSAIQQSQFRADVHGHTVTYKMKSNWSHCSARIKNSFEALVEDFGGSEKAMISEKLEQLSGYGICQDR